MATRLGAVDGRPVVVKELGPGPGADRLRREAAALHHAAHPGVVEVVGLDEDDGGGVTLTTGFVGGRTLAELPGTALDSALATGLARELAATLGELHARGVVHGRLSADHVLVAAGDRPVLCGLAGARLPGDGAHGPAPADDVAALGALLASLAEAVGGPGAQALRAAAGRARAPDA
ncbi:MAG: phosphotransferase, partial [Acidimicrobiales bacterium]